MAEESTVTGHEPNSLVEISSQHTPIIFVSQRNSFHTDFNEVPTIAAPGGTDTFDVGMTSPLFTQEREVNPPSDSVHRQAAVSGSSNTQQPASSTVMHDGRSCGKLQHCAHVARSCGKLQHSDCSDVEKSLFNGKRSCIWQCVVPRTRKVPIW